MAERLQKIVARAGIASRRAAEDLVTAGRVRVNGRVVTELGSQADPRSDRIEVDGRLILAEDPVYIVLHKPRDVVSTMQDPEGRPTVADLLRKIDARVFPVGRLDFATSGVLLITNDGDFSQGMLHPRRGVPKTYVVKVRGHMGDEDLERWRTGIDLEDGRTLPAEVKLVRYEEDRTWIEVTIQEGRNQQLRRMGEATGFFVMRLARVSFAGITSEGLRPGQWRDLSRDELMALRDTYGVPKRVRGVERAGEGVQGRIMQRGIERGGDRGRPSRDEARRPPPRRDDGRAGPRMDRSAAPDARPARDRDRPAFDRDDRRPPPWREDGSSPVARGDQATHAARDDRRGPPFRDDRRGPPLRDDRRGPPLRDDRRGPPTDDRRPAFGRDDRRGPPRDDRRGAPRDDRRGPPRDARGGSPRDARKGPPGDDRASSPRDERGSTPRDERRGPPPIDRRPGPPRDERRGPPGADRRPGSARDERRGPPGGDRSSGPRTDRPATPRDERRGPPRGERRAPPRRR